MTFVLFFKFIVKGTFVILKKINFKWIGSMTFLVREIWIQFSDFDFFSGFSNPISPMFMEICSLVKIRLFQSRRKCPFGIWKVEATAEVWFYDLNKPNQKGTGSNLDTTQIFHIFVDYIRQANRSLIFSEKGRDAYNQH